MLFSESDNKNSRVLQALNFVTVKAKKPCKMKMSRVALCCVALAEIRTPVICVGEGKPQLLYFPAVFA